MKTSSRQSGFTLLEIMLVVSIIVILLGVAISQIGNPGGMVKSEVAVKSDIQGITSQLRLYESINGFLPTTEQGLQALVTQPSTEPKPTRWYQLFKKIPKDPYGNYYVYLCPGRKNPNSFDLYSAGPDRKPDTADDNWGE
jgi:general secretion pathway protein G